MRAQPNAVQLNAQHYKLHTHENDHYNFATTDYADGTDFIKADFARTVITEQNICCCVIDESE